MSKKLLRYGFCPLMLVGVSGVAICLMSSEAPKGWLLLLLGIAIAISFSAERVLPYVVEWNQSDGDARRDALHALVNEGANFGTLLLLPVFTSFLAVGGI